MSGERTDHVGDERVSVGFCLLWSDSVSAECPGWGESEHTLIFSAVPTLSTDFQFVALQAPKQTDMHIESVKDRRGWVSSPQPLQRSAGNAELS